MRSGIWGELGSTHIDELIHDFSALKIIDLGVIQSYKPSTGTVDVQLFSTNLTTRSMLTNVEVVYVGNADNGISGDIVGAPCLVFYPRSVVTSLKKRTIDITKRPYDPVGAKCLPLSTCNGVKLRVGFNSAGEFVLQSEGFILSINADAISYTNAAKTLQYSLSATNGMEKIEGAGKIHNETNDDGSIYIYYENNEGKVAYILHYTPDGKYEIQRNAFEAWDEAARDDHSTFTKYMWKETYNNDGSRQITQVADNGDVLNDITISASGDVSIAQTKAGSSVELKQDGSISAIGANGVSIDGANGKLNIGNGQYTIKDAFNDLITVLDTFKTQGSPAAHTAVPMQFEMLKQKLALLFE